MTLTPTRLRRLIATSLVCGLIAPVLVTYEASGTATSRPYRTVSLRNDGFVVEGGARDSLGAALHRRAGEIGLSPDEFSIDAVRRSPLGRHVRGGQMRDGVRVDGTWLVAWISNRSVQRIDLRVSDLPGRPSAEPIDRSRALALARTLMGSPREIVPARGERFLVPRNGRLVDVWRVTVLADGEVAQLDLSAATGELITRRDPARYEDTTATVFDPNPVVALKDPSLRQPGVDTGGVDTDLDDPRLTGALVKLPIRQADPSVYTSGRLVGPNVDVQGPAPLTKGADGFTFTRGDPRFETTMAYAHIDRLQRYFQTTLGLTTLNAEPQNVYTVPLQGFDNSLYVGGFDIIVFGAGGVDDGEDGEVIVHEYGHAIQDDQVPGWGQTDQSRAMGEGFGDFLAAAFFARNSSGGFQDTCIADWDATSYSDGTPPCLRRVDGTKRFPDDMTGEEHADGEIWSAFLWTLRTSLGLDPVERSDNTLRLVLTSHELLTPSATFKAGVAALKTSAKTLGRLDWVTLIKKAAAAYGLGQP